MDRVLSSWKEIADYLHKSVRTVQRWEKDLRLPIHRPARGSGRIVLVDTAELDAWLRHSTKVQQTEPAAACRQLKERRKQTRQRCAALRAECQSLRRTMHELRQPSAKHASAAD